MPAFKHGHSVRRKHTPTYNSWDHMRQRCLNPKNEGYRDYGGRGIKIHQSWDSFETFFRDMGERPQGLTLDRIDVNGDYESSNCRWATRKMQQRNQRRPRRRPRPMSWLRLFSVEELMSEINRRKLLLTCPLA